MPEFPNLPERLELTRRQFLTRTTLLTGGLTFLKSTGGVLGGETEGELSFRIYRNADQMSVEFRFLNFEHNAGTLRPKGGRMARIAMRFAPQNLAEEIFPEPPKTEGSDELPPLLADDRAGAPVRTFLSGPSWLVFDYDEREGSLPLDPRQWLELIANPVKSPLIVPGAVLDPTLAQDPLTGRVQPRPPRLDETAIEVPFRLFMAPSVPTVAIPSQQRGMGRSDGFNVLWHVALRSRYAIPPASPPKDLPPEGLPPALQPPKRVTLKTRPFYSPDHLRSSEPKFSQYFPKNKELSLHALTRHLLVEQIMGGDGIIDVERLELSPLGANASFYYASQKGIEEIEAKQMADGCILDDPNQKGRSGGKPQTHLYLWKHRIVVGRDVFFAEAFFGWLFPFQHPAIYVELTERKFVAHKQDGVATDSPPGAYLLKRRFIIRLKDIRRHLGSDSSLGREMALKQIRLVTPQSPDLRKPDGQVRRPNGEKDEPNDTIQENLDQIALEFPNTGEIVSAIGDRGLYFFPTSATGEPVVWELETEDESGNKQQTSEARLFFATHLRVGRAVYGRLRKDLRSIHFKSSKIAFAPEAPVISVPLPGGLLGVTLPGDRDLRTLAGFAGRRLLEQLRQQAPETRAAQLAAIDLIGKTVADAGAWGDKTKNELLAGIEGPLDDLKGLIGDTAEMAAAWGKKYRALLDLLTDPDTLVWQVDDSLRPLAEFVGKRLLETAALLDSDIGALVKAKDAALSAAREEAKKAGEELDEAKKKLVRWTEENVDQMEGEIDAVINRLQTEGKHARHLIEEASAQLGKVRDLSTTLETRVMTFSSEILGREVDAAKTLYSKVLNTPFQFLENFDKPDFGFLALPGFEKPVIDRITARLNEARAAILGQAPYDAGFRQLLKDAIRDAPVPDRGALEKVIKLVDTTNFPDWTTLVTKLCNAVELEAFVTNGGLAGEAKDLVVAQMAIARDRLQDRVKKLLGGLDSARHDAEAIGTRALQAVMEEAEVVIPALKGVANDVAARAINFADGYLAGSFEEAKNGAFARLSEPINEGKKLVQDVKNGLATPALIVAGISREIGVIAGEGKEAVDKFARQIRDINLDDAIPDAKLFGCLELKSLLAPLLRGKLPDWKTLELPDRIERTFAWLAPLKKLNLAIVTFEPKADCHFWLHARTTILLKGQSPEGQVELIGWIGKWDAEKGKVGEDGSQQDGRARVTPPDESFALDLLGLVRVGFSQIDMHASYRTSQGLQKPQVKPTIGEVSFLGPLRFVQTLEEYLGDLFGGGFKLRFTGVHIHVELGVAFPPISFGAFSMTNISFWAGLALPLGESPLQFKFALASFEKPFELSVMGFAGRGFFSIGFDTSGDRLLKGALEFGGALSFNIAVASGGLYVMAGIYYESTADAMLLRGYLRAGGFLNVLCLINASVEFSLGLSFQELPQIGDTAGGSEVFGFCTITVSIEFCFWSMDVSIGMEKHLAGSSGGNNSQRARKWNERFAILAGHGEPSQPRAEARPFIGGAGARFENFDRFQQDYWSYFSR
ncbi:MAG: hypothetical protein V4819_21025 [Verrucomicrobiota bacterium]